MAASLGSMLCKLFRSAFSGEVVFQVRTSKGEVYEAVAPKHYAAPQCPSSASGESGRLKVHVLANGGNEARISAPDGQVLTVPADQVNDG